MRNELTDKSQIEEVWGKRSKKKSHYNVSNETTRYGFVDKHNAHDLTEKKNIHEVVLRSLSA